MLSQIQENAAVFARKVVSKRGAIMPHKSVQNLLRTLNTRRRDLRMTFAVLAKRCGVSVSTVTRTLTGHNPNISLESVVTIAEILGMDISIAPSIGVSELLEEQARQKARRLATIVQGTLGLEAQAINDNELNDLTRQTAHKLLAGPSRKLWSE